MTIPGYSQIKETKRILLKLLKDPKLNLPNEISSLSASDLDGLIKYTNEQPDQIVLPCRLKECEVASALKSIEALYSQLITNQRFPEFASKSNIVTLDLQHCLMFLFMAYLASVDDMTKLDKKVIKRLRDTDLNKAQSITYRRMSANLYKTKDERYYHIHGSLDATTTLNMIGLPGFDDSLTDYDEVVKVIQAAVAKFNCDDLEKLNVENRQAGVECIKYNQFLKSEQGKITEEKPFWEVDILEAETPPAEYSPIDTKVEKRPQILKGIKVLELCRIIAGPTIGRILAEYGAEVLKVTDSEHLPDVPFFQVDGNMGKHCCDLNLKNSEDRLVFEELLKDADIVLDGYRLGAIEKLGYGPQVLKELAIKRGKGYIYASENCFGYEGPYSGRPGWQQIADCYSGVAWIQGTNLIPENNEPMIPPFPMSDYGTGCMVAIAVLDAVYQRAKKGGSYWCKSSLVQYDSLLIKQGLYPDDIWEQIKSRQSPDVFKLRYYDSVDKISSTCLRSMKAFKPDLFDGDLKYMDEWQSEGFGGMVKVLKPVVHLDLTRNEFNCTSRPNGFDKPEWWM
ncbi:hypothetical protein CANARDRAFT_29086 [[Candida] arabinofermentans NRRL YB-2248]|uniref:CoA-transferase family III n=1 Tax=[Candida] arabinofermentans NRRL YB-2248 TaxID=983967 RepID=A0A1E4SYI9_9ASCO|nr:hypothetical protein CANARDRAFT_29086 [[Candida] arabinofermentans NRRL YB-2248]